MRNIASGGSSEDFLEHFNKTTRAPVSQFASHSLNRHAARQRLERKRDVKLLPPATETKTCLPYQNATQSSFTQTEPPCPELHRSPVSGVRKHAPKRFAFDLPPTLPAPKLGSGVSFLFLLPGVGETLRINGSTEDRAERKLVVSVEEAFIHCAQCILRSGLWRTARPLHLLPFPPLAHASPGPLHTPAVASFLAAAPFALLSSWDGQGAGDTSPRGDEPGFLRIINGETLVIPDRKGNHRTDTFHNLLSCPQIAVVAIIPGRQDVLQMRGTAYVTDEPALLESMVLGGKLPLLALVIRVEHAELASNDAIRTSKLWSAKANTENPPDLISVSAKHVTRNVVAGSKARSGVRAALTGIFLALLNGTLGAFPRFFRRLLDSSYRKNLTAEGYSLTGSEGATRLPAFGGRTVRVIALSRASTCAERTQPRRAPVKQF